MKYGTMCIGIAGLVIFSFGLFTHFFIAYDYYYFVAGHFVLGVLLLLIFLLRGGLNWMRTAAARRAAGHGASAVLYSLIFLLMLGVLNFIALRFDPLYFDSTEEKVFTLAPQTKKVLSSCKKPITMRLFSVGEEIDSKLKLLLLRIVREQKLLSLELVDAEKRPDLVRKYGVTESGTLHFSYDDESISREAKVVRNIDEQEITNALLKLVRVDEATVYFITGHGESDLEDVQSHTGLFFMKEAVKGEAIELKPLVLGQVKEIPEDAKALILAAPKKELLVQEKELIKQYLSNGGNALLLHEPNTSESVREIAESFGIIVGRDVILDDLEMGQIGVQPVVTDYGLHLITADFQQGTIFPIASSVRRAPELPPGANVTELALTSKNSWAETDVLRVFSDAPEASFDPEDLAGPVSLAAAFEGSLPQAVEKQENAAENSAPKSQKTARLVVFGDADFITNVNIRQLYNRDFFLNALNWVIGADQVIALRERTYRKSLQGLSDEQLRPLYLITAVLVPEALVLLGFLVWWNRKRSS